MFYGMFSLYLICAFGSHTKVIFILTKIIFRLYSGTNRIFTLGCGI